MRDPPLAFTLLSYALAKIIPTQFIHLQAQQLNESYGQSTPMALLWRFVGFSTPYTLFGGFAELLAAVLLLFRRTALLGSLLAFAVLLNIVALNFCYDVPVKLYSLNLLLLALYLVFSDRERLVRFFMNNLRVAASNISRPVLIHRHRRRAQILKIAVVSLVLILHHLQLKRPAAHPDKFSDSRAQDEFLCHRSPTCRQG